MSEGPDARSGFSRHHVVVFSADRAWESVLPRPHGGRQCSGQKIKYFVPKTNLKESF